MRAIKLPFTKRITTAGVVDSKPRKAVSDLLRFPAAIIADGVNDFGVDRIVSPGPRSDWADRSSIERFGATRAGCPVVPGENR